MDKNLASRTASASAALLGARLFVKIIDFALILILARILVPEDFALVALATIFIQFTEAILEIPVAQALIRTPKINDDMLDTAFTISFIRALLLAFLVVAASPFAVAFFDEPRLGPLMALLALAPAIRGLVNPRLVMYARRLNYFPEALIDTFAKVVTTAIAIPLAIKTGSYWSLAVMNVLTPITVLIGSYLFAPYRPRLSLKEWPVFSNMISWTTLSQIFSAANWQIDIVMVGRALSADVVGKYSMAQTLASAPIQVFVVPISKPFIAAFKEIKGIAGLRSGYLQALSAVFAAVSPILTLIVCLADPIVAILFNDAWEGATIFLAVLSFSSVIGLTAFPLSNLALSLNKARWNAIQALIGLSVKGPLLVVGLYFFGVGGFLAGQVVGVFAWAVAGWIIVKRLIGLSVWSQIAALARPTSALTVMAAIVVSVNSILPSDLHPLIVLVGLGAFGTGAYVATLFILWRFVGQPEGLEKMTASLAAKLIKRNATQST